MSKPDFSNLARATADVAAAARSRSTGPADPRGYAALRTRLRNVRARLPPLYRATVYDPFIAKLDDLGAKGVAAIVARDPQRESEAGLLYDIVQALLQQAENYAQRATDAYQEVISDLYDGFLSAEDRRGVKRPDRSVIAPLVKWGAPDAGPYTWPVDAASSFGLETGIVSMPPASATRGLLAWAALGHETAGHDIMGADTGLEAELAATVGSALVNAGLGKPMADYWSERIAETASDVMGILNLGPVAAIGLIAFLRAFVGGALRNEGPADDPHPADIVRGWLGAEVVGLLGFAGRQGWARAISAETDRDLGVVVLAGRTVPAATARKAAAVIAKAIAQTPLAALEHHALGEIQNWADRDERLAQSIAAEIVKPGGTAPKAPAAAYAAHALAAGCMATLGKYATSDAAVARIFDRTLGVLKTMHDSNPSWGPLYVAHPGDFARHLAIGRG